MVPDIIKYFKNLSWIAEVLNFNTMYATKASDMMGNIAMKTLQKLEPKMSQTMLTGWCFVAVDPAICFDIPNSIPNRVKIFRRRKTNSYQLKE
jgi:hypothetical protein